MGMLVRVKLFAALRSPRFAVEPGSSFPVEVAEGARVQDLVEKLELPRQEVKAVFVNGRARPLDWALKSDDEVGIFPPIGGGVCLI